LLENHIAVGKISRTADKEGRVKVIPLTDFPDRFKKLKFVYLYDERECRYLTGAETEYFEISESEVCTGKIEIKFKGISSAEDASRLKNALICIEEKDRIPLPEGMFYLYELAGYKVKDGDIEIGIVEKVDNYGSDDLLKVMRAGKKFFYVPINEFFIKQIDGTNKEIKINLIEGLSEQNES
jgi:16S rRNA processing protein RimM